jgi:cobalt/nickel transport system permease protein
MYGIATCAFLSTIVLIFQAILLAHGGLTTLGANICSMGIIGPAVGLGVWLLMIKGGVKIPIALFCATLVADLFTYVVTAFQMSLNFGFEYFVDYLTNYAVTQIPLAIVEGILFFMFGMYLMNNKPEIFDIAQGVAEANAKKEGA